MKKLLKNQKVKAVFFFMFPLVFTHVAFLLLVSLSSYVIPAATYAALVTLSYAMIDPIYLASILFAWSLICIPFIFSKHLIKIE